MKFLKIKKIFFIIIIILGIFIFNKVEAKHSGTPGSQFPGTCAETMADVPLTDAYFDTSEAGKKSYALSSWYENAVQAWRSTNLQKITFAGQTKDKINQDIYVNKAAANDFTNFGKAIAECEEVKQGIYHITVYDHFACRMITASASTEKKLSTHANGKAIDINVPTNKYTTKTCQPGGCDFSPCIIQAAKDNNISWGGGLITPALYPGICDAQHFEWTGTGSNISDSDLNFCKTTPVFRTDHKIGSLCNSNSDCQSNDCESSTKKDSSGNTLSFCDCGEVDLSVTGFDESQDCADAYGGNKADWTCKDGPPATWDLDYCLNNLVAKNTKFPVEPLADLSFRDYILDPTMAYLATSEDELKDILTRKPVPLIKIPGLSFSGGKEVEDALGKYIVIPFFGEYLAAIYKYGVVIASIIAVVMIINNGLKWIMSGGTPEKINDAKKRIMQSIVGLLLAVGSYALLFYINPELVKFVNLRIKTVDKKTLTNLEVGYYEEGSISTIASYDLVRKGFVKAALSPSTCVDYQGFSLDTREKRATRLKQILKIWKNIAVDQGGALYSAGGRLNADGSCRNTGNAFYLGGKISQAILMQNIKKLKNDKEPILLNGLTFNMANITAAQTVAVGITNCWDLLTKSVSISLTDDLAKGDNTSSSDRNITNGMKFFGLDVKKESVATCVTVYRKLYANLYSDIATASGRLCGDCGSFQESLFYNCFDTRIVGEDIKKNYHFKSTSKSTSYTVTNSNITKIEEELKFGSLIRLPGHWIMYTGKSNDPAINYVIFEMGGGYASPTGISAEKTIRETFDPGYYFSSAKVNTDFTAYMKNVIEKKGTDKPKSINITVFDLLDPTNFPPF